MNYRSLFLGSLLCVPIESSCQKKSTKPILIDDFSRLNSTQGASILEPIDEKELSEILVDAHIQNQKVSVSGIRHSQGGQAFYKDAVVISLAKMNKVLSIEGNFLTVQAGITWKEVQEYLNPLDKGVATMQFLNIFTVGGSLSVNANGIDPQKGPLIESVRSFKIMMADGRVFQASRTENAELFRLALGGYGLFGILIEATLEVTSNDFYKKEVKRLSIEDYANTWRSITTHPELGFHFAQLTFSSWGDKAFSGVRSITYTKIEPSSLTPHEKEKYKKLNPERFVSLKALMHGWLRAVPFAKFFQGDGDFVPAGATLSRNNIMSPHALHLHYEAAQESDLMQEYFVPIESFVPFITFFDQLTEMFTLDLATVQVRFIKKNAESFLSYTPEDCFGVMIHFSQKHTPEDIRMTQRWTKLLIDEVIKRRGRFYLPSQLYATREQIRKAYPQLDDFFHAKRKYDPKELFINHFYKKYA